MGVMPRRGQPRGIVRDYVPFYYFGFVNQEGRVDDEKKLSVVDGVNVGVG